MIKLAIVEDNIQERKQLRELLSKSLNQRNLTFCLQEYESGDDLLHYVEKGNSFDIIFLDIYMKKNGLETARCLKESPQKSKKIIFVTSSPFHALDAFNVHASGYLVKPVILQKLEELLDITLKEIHNDNLKSSKQLLIKSKGLSLTVPYNNILSVESSLKKVYIYLTDGKSYECTDLTLTQVFERLNDERFLRCHNSFVVNMDKITAVTFSYFTLEHNKTADITKRNFATMKRKYFSYLTSNI